MFQVKTYKTNQYILDVKENYLTVFSLNGPDVYDSLPSPSPQGQGTLRCATPQGVKGATRNENWLTFHVRTERFCTCTQAFLSLSHSTRILFFNFSLMLGKAFPSHESLPPQKNPPKVMKNSVTEKVKDMLS